MIGVSLIDKRKPFIRLARVTETDSGRTWIFTFVDPLHKFMQSIILVKADNAGEKMEELMENLYMGWKRRIGSRMVLPS